MTFLNLKYSLASIAMLASFAASALPNDSSQPVNIQADSAAFDQQLGQATYKGSVVVTQGSIVIEAEELIITTDPTSGEFKKLHATGSPSKFSQQINEAGKTMSANGKSLDYDASLGQLEIHDQGYLQRGDDEISADYIHYLLTDETFRAENRGTGRVNMTLQPLETQPATEQQ